MGINTDWMKDPALMNIPIQKLQFLQIFSGSFFEIFTKSDLRAE